MKRRQPYYVDDIQQIANVQVFPGPFSPPPSCRWQIQFSFVKSRRNKKTQSRTIKRTRPRDARPDANVYLTSADQVCLGRQQIHDFSLALVAPLRAEHHRHSVAVVAARTLLSRGGRLVRGSVVFARPVERHGGVSPSVSRRLSCLRGWHFHICPLMADDVRARRAPVRRCALTSCLQGCWEQPEDSLSTTFSTTASVFSTGLLLFFGCFQLSETHLGVTVREKLPEQVKKKK